MNHAATVSVPSSPSRATCATRSIRVMHILPSLAMGGMENGIVNLCNGLSQERFESSIAVIKGGGPLEARLHGGRTKVHTVPRAFGNDPRVALRLAHLLRRHHIDILHSHSWGVLIESVAAARLAGAALIHGEHGAIEASP